MLILWHNNAKIFYIIYHKVSMLCQHSITHIVSIPSNTFGFKVGLKHFQNTCAYTQLLSKYLLVDCTLKKSCSQICSKWLLLRLQHFHNTYYWTFTWTFHSNFYLIMCMISSRYKILLLCLTFCWLQFLFYVKPIIGNVFYINQMFFTSNQIYRQI